MTFFVRVRGVSELVGWEVHVQQTERDIDGTRAVALNALGDARIKKLRAISRFLAMTAVQPDDLLHGAFLRWLESDKAVESPDATYRFLVGAMKSIRSNTFRHDGVVKRVLGDRILSPEGTGDGTEQVVAEANSAEESRIAQQAFDLFAKDPEVQDYILLMAEGASRAEIQKELDWDDRKYQAVQKRRARAVARFISEGKL